MCTLEPRSPVVRAVIKWAQRVLHHHHKAHAGAEPDDTALRWCDRQRTFVDQAVLRGTLVAFDTRSVESFELVKQLLALHGVDVCDVHDVRDTATTPLLVYHRTSAETAHQAHHFLKTRRGKIAAILDKPVDLSKDIDSISAAEIYDNLFQLVRAKLREGNSNAEIQAIVDAKFDAILQAERAVLAALAAAATTQETHATHQSQI